MLLMPGAASAQQKIVAGKVLIEKEAADAAVSGKKGACCKKEAQGCCGKHDGKAKHHGKAKHDCKGKRDGKMLRDGKGKQCCGCQCMGAGNGKLQLKKQNIFAGLNLTDAQKARIKELKEGQKENGRKLAEQLRKAREAGDTAAMKLNPKREMRKQYLASLKSILTPEQYNALLENFFINGAAQPRGHKPHRR